MRAVSRRVEISEDRILVAKRDEIADPAGHEMICICRLRPRQDGLDAIP
jgi:hypothetical protein